jgi:predicted  nucleic acid-binding Zn-ribbon protein
VCCSFALVSCVLITECSRSNERERQTLQTEKERAHNALRTHEKDLSDMQLREVNLRSQLKDRDMLEKQVEEMKTEVAAASQNFKVGIRFTLLHHIYLLRFPIPGHRF